MSQPIRRAAVEIVLREESDRGWQAQALGASGTEKEHGCDILSTPPEGGDPHPVEVKGWGEPFLSLNGVFRYTQDIRESQFQAAQRNADYRLEVVANLTEYLAGIGAYERLTLTADHIRERAVPRLYDVSLAGLKGEIRIGAHPRPEPGTPS
jgi:hypothetical protein